MKSEELKNQEYKYGFTTDVENIRAPKGLNEETIKFISNIKRVYNITKKSEMLSNSIKIKKELFVFKEEKQLYNFLIKLGVSRKTAENDSEGIEHHVSDETLKLMKKFK